MAKVIGLVESVCPNCLKKIMGQKVEYEDVENVYVVKDDIEYGMRNVVPLWAFGFLY